MTSLARVRGFYAILDADDEGLATRLVAPDGCAATVLQVRLKHATTRELLAACAMARRVTAAVGALLIVNDRLDVALAVEADGVHLGQDDLPLEPAQAALGDARVRMVIGISTHSLAQVERAVAGGADYLGFGPVFPTRTKANPDPVVGLAGLAAAVAAAGSVPIVAIGGMTSEVAAAVYAAGATALCAISAVNDAADVAAAGRAFQRSVSARAPHLG